MPRNRSGGLAALGSSVRRSASPSYSSRAAGTLKRRIVIGALVLASLALVTGYFRETESGALHDAQSFGASALRPFEVAAERVARPFRDAYGYFDRLFEAKSQNERLRLQVRRLRQQAAQNAAAQQELADLTKLIRYRRSTSFPRDYDAVAATVLSQAPSRFEQQILISAGSSDGVGLDAPVVTADGLVGKVTKVASNVSRVTLLTDEDSAVSAYDVQTDAYGVVRHGQGDSLILDRVPKEDIVERGHSIVTSGRRFGKLASLYPRQIQIGVVRFVGQTDIDIHQRVQVTPYVDFSSLNNVLVLIPKA